MADSIPKLMAFINALNDAKQGNPVARAAMPAAKNAAFPPEDNKVMGGPSSGVPADLYDPQRFAPMNFDGSLQDIRGGSSQALNPPPSGPGGPSILPAGKDRTSLGLLTPTASGVQNTGAGVHEQNEPLDMNFAERDAPEKKGSFWTSDAFTDRMQIAGSALLGAGIGKLTGLGGTAVGGYAGAAGVKDFQQKQQEQLARRHKLFEDVYGQVNALPAEIYTTPGMEGLAQAAEAVRKDMADGKVDNEKNLSLFLTEKAKYGTELNDIETNKKIEEQGKIQDALFQQDVQRKEQRALQLRALLQDPMASPQEKEQAQAELFEIDKVRQEFQMRKASQEDEMRHRREMEAQGRAGLGIQQQGLNQRFELGMSGIQGRQDVARMGATSRAINQEVERARKMAEVQGTPFDEGQAQNDALKRAMGVEVLSPGNLIVMGQRVRMADLLGEGSSNLWDAGGTPSKLGWDRIFAQLRSQVQGAENQMNTPQAMGMTNIQYQ